VEGREAREGGRSAVPVLVRALVRLELGLELGLAGVERVEHGGADERADCPRRGLREALPVHPAAAVPRHRSLSSPGRRDPEGIFPLRSACRLLAHPSGPTSCCERRGRGSRVPASEGSRAGKRAAGVNRRGDGEEGDVTADGGGSGIAGIGWVPAAPPAGARRAKWAFDCAELRWYTPRGPARWFLRCFVRAARYVRRLFGFGVGSLAAGASRAHVPTALALGSAHDGASERRRPRSWIDRLGSGPGGCFFYNLILLKVFIFGPAEIFAEMYSQHSAKGPTVLFHVISLCCNGTEPKTMTPCCTCIFC
jgi:hypothetical protein